MNRIKVIIYLFILLLSKQLVAQVDTVSFNFVPDVATFKIKCQSQKVNIVGTDTTFVDFVIADTVNGAYTFDWGGDIEPLIDGLPLVTYQFTTPGVYTFDLSIYEDATGKTITDSKTFEIHDLIRVPNVFTPNGDGLNDQFRINANGITPLEIWIYSRTGTLIFNTKSPIIVWDGRSSSGSVVSEGVYFYKLVSDDPVVPEQQGFFHIYINKP